MSEKTDAGWLSVWTLVVLGAMLIFIDIYARPFERDGSLCWTVDVSWTGQGDTIACIPVTYRGGR